MTLLSAVLPIVLFLGLVLLVVVGLRSLTRDRRHGALAASLETLQELFEPETRKAHEQREEERESAPRPGDSDR